MMVKAASRPSQRPETPAAAWARNVGETAAVRLAGVRGIVVAAHPGSSYLRQKTELMRGLIGLTLILPGFWVMETLDRRDRLRRLRAEAVA